MEISDKWQKCYETVWHAVHSSRGRDVLLYLLFLCVAFVFWLAMSLDTEIQREFEVPVEVDNVPDSITLIGHLPPSISVGVQAKGYQLLRYSWGRMPMLKLKMTDYMSHDHYFELSKVKIDNRMRDYFGSSVLITSFRPDSIKIPYTTLPGSKVKLKVNADIQPDLQCVVSGAVTANVDSVRVFSLNGIPSSLKQIETETIIAHEIKDTTRYEVRIKQVEGMYIIPDRVIVTVPVEPLISKKLTVAVAISNLPVSTDMITFPSKVEVSYLVPMNFYNEDCPIKVFVDYADVANNTPRLKLHHSLVPDLYRDIVIKPDSVEYIIEHL